MCGRTFPILMAILLMAPGGGLRAQSDPAPPILLPSGISLKTGLGRYSLRDEYFSHEKYSGTLPLFSASWSRSYAGGGFSIGVEHRTSSEIRNHNISSGVTSFSLDLDLLYRVATLDVFSQEASLFLGPSTGFFLHFSELDIAYSEFEIPFSFAMLLPIGLNSTLVLPVSERLHFVGSVESSIFSLGLRMIDFAEEVDEESPVRFLTPFSGANAELNLGWRLAVSSRVWVDLGYRLQLLRIRPWDPLLSASDNLLVGFTVGL